MPDEPKASLAVGDIRVDFYWRGDRFSHTLSVVRDDQPQVVWRSIHESPHAPVFQELHEQTNPGGANILFLSGAGGDAHWSMSVEHDCQAICFDVAARVTKPPTDRVIDYVAASTEQKPGILLGPEVGDSEAVDVAHYRCFPLTLPDSSLPLTLRWRYMAR